MVDPGSAQVTSSGAGQLSSPGLVLRLWECEWRWSLTAVGTGYGILSCYSMIALPLGQVVMTPLSAPGAKEHHGIEGAGGSQNWTLQSPGGSGSGTSIQGPPIQVSASVLNAQRQPWRVP